MKRVNIREAKAHFSRLVQRAAAGEEIIISRNGKPVAKLVPLTENNLAPAGEDMTPRVAGSMRGKIWIADDFDDPLPPEILARFYGDP
jgi:prevent-host-death family protein